MQWIPGTTAEGKRLAEGTVWRAWGPYLSERQWGTVREDYSAGGSAWDYFTHDQARSRAYRWGEDGLLGISDEGQNLCFAVGLWNHQDAILKERIFGLTNSQGNHGEDVKELYYYLDSSPTHSYLKALYKYPQRPFPYEELIEVNAARSVWEREYELWNTTALDENRYFDILVEYAKDDAQTVFIRLTVTNQGPEAAPVTLLGQLWFRNRWAWNDRHAKPHLALQGGVVCATHETLGARYLVAQDGPDWIFTENETNGERVFGGSNASPYVKDSFHRYVVNGETAAVNPAQTGTKCASLTQWNLAPGETRSLILRLGPAKTKLDVKKAESLFAKRIAETDAFYQAVTPGLTPEVANVQRQAFAGLLWSKQFYHLDVRAWLDGDPLQPPPPPGREKGRNHTWGYFDAEDVLAMPDTWEYPWFASWDLAFHCLVYALIDPGFAKDQLVLLLREWYMHPNGQIPAYEWSFSDVNPPVHAWAAWRVYTIERRATGKGDREFLEKVFQKLLLNFTWWVNRKDAGGNNVFEGGFLGLDNIGVFDRSQLPPGCTLEQADATSWMAMFCLNMMTIALELANENPVYEDLATKFLEHYLYIANAINNMGPDNLELWDEEDGFYYDLLSTSSGTCERLKVRSWVGLIPLFAVTTLEQSVFTQYPGFTERMEWFFKNRPSYVSNVASMTAPGSGERRLFSLVPPQRLLRLVQRLMSTGEFLSPYGVRAVSRFHKAQPFTLTVDGATYGVDYEPGESTTKAFGGNSNWRGPIWMPLNYLLIEAIQNFGYYYQDLTIELPGDSGLPPSTLDQIARELEKRLISLFLPDEKGQRPCLQEAGPYDQPSWKDLVLFHEYFEGDTGRGLGANHQTGWTALVAKMIQQVYFTHAPDHGDQSNESA